MLSADYLLYTRDVEVLLTLPHERPQQCSLHVVSFGAGDFGEYVNVYSSTRPAFT